MLSDVSVSASFRHQTRTRNLNFSTNMSISEALNVKTKLKELSETTERNSTERRCKQIANFLQLPQEHLIILSLKKKFGGKIWVLFSVL